MTSEPKFTMELACCESVILNEIGMGLNQKQIAQSYALALRSSWPTDWKAVNEAIIKRWSVAGLTRIKNMAWSGKCFDKPVAKESP
jgi:hypothetical protein